MLPRILDNDIFKTGLLLVMEYCNFYIAISRLLLLLRILHILYLSLILDDTQTHIQIHTLENYLHENGIHQCLLAL